MSVSPLVHRVKKQGKYSAFIFSERTLTLDPRRQLLFISRVGESDCPCHHKLHLCEVLLWPFYSDKLVAEPTKSSAAALTVVIKAQRHPIMSEDLDYLALMSSKSGGGGSSAAENIICQPASAWRAALTGQPTRRGSSTVTGRVEDELSSEEEECAGGMGGSQQLHPASGAARNPLLAASATFLSCVDDAQTQEAQRGGSKTVSTIVLRCDSVEALTNLVSALAPMCSVSNSGGGHHSGQKRAVMAGSVDDVAAHVKMRLERRQNK